MKLAVRRRVLAAVPVVALAVTGCSIHEQTQRWYAPANGVNGDAGDIGLRNVLLVADDDGNATVMATLSNEGMDADQLTGMVVNDSPVQLSTGELDIPAGGVANIGPEAERIDLSATDLVPGSMTEIEFRFDNASRTTVDALVRPTEGEFANALQGAPTSDDPTDVPTPDDPTGDETPDSTDPDAPEDGGAEEPADNETGADETVDDEATSDEPAVDETGSPTDTPTAESD